MNRGSKFRNFIGILLAATGWIAVVAPAQAQPTTLNFVLTATYQNQDTSNPAGTLTVSTTKSLKWTSASLLALVTNNTGAPFPRGAYLAQDNGAVEVILDKALDSTNLDTVFTFNLSGISVNSGTANATTGQQSESYLIYATATFDDGNGNNFSVDGLIRETISISAQDANGNQTESISFSGTVAGSGSVVDKTGNTDTAVFSGIISGAGKGPSGS